MRHHLRLSVTALLLAVLLLPAGAAAAIAEADETNDDAEIEIGPGFDEAPEEIRETDSLELSGLLDVFATPTPVPTTEPTMEPTKAPKEKQPPWLTSVNYPKDKINFENEIWSILTGKWGLKDFQAAGLMSSIQAESSFCPYNVQGRGGSDDRGGYEYDINDSIGFGLCQWTSSGRKAALYHYAVSRGSGDLVWDFDTQMGFLAKELGAMESLKGTKNLYDAAEWTVMRFERPNQRYANSWPGTRYEKGKQIYKRHAGRDYEEPAARFSVSRDGSDALTAGLLALEADKPGRLAVSCNYYWRLEQVDATVDGWLEVQCPSFYYPDRMESCVCGYACEGKKTLTLSVAKAPEPGQTYATTLRFEIFRGGHEVRTLTLTLTCPPLEGGDGEDLLPDDLVRTEATPGDGSEDGAVTEASPEESSEDSAGADAEAAPGENPEESPETSTDADAATP